MMICVRLILNLLGNAIVKS